jgi:hypothetical protein
MSTECRNCGEIESEHCPECGACYFEAPHCNNPECDGSEEVAS